MVAVLLLVAAANVPQIDVAFALDTTGSMGDEIDVVKEKIARMADGQMMHLTHARVSRAADGRKYSVLSEGGRTWVADRELEDSEWRKERGSAGEGRQGARGRGAAGRGVDGGPGEEQSRRGDRPWRAGQG